MDEKNGWIKLYRSMLNNPIVMKDADHLAVWVYLLLNATHEEYKVLFKGKKVTLKPGQLITGRKALSRALGVTESKVYRILSLFKAEHQIEQQVSNRNSVISIVCWQKYQTDEQQVNNRRTADSAHMSNKQAKSEQQVDSQKLVSEPHTSNEQTKSEQLVNNWRTTDEHKQECKEEEECKEYKNTPISPQGGSTVFGQRIRRKLARKLLGKLSAG